MEIPQSDLNYNSSQGVTPLVDKRPFYIWLIVILANIGTYLTVVIMEVYDGGASVLNALFGVIPGYLPILGISVFVSVIPVWLSGSKLKWRNRFGFGIPILLLFPIPYLVWHMNTCTGKFCGLGDMILIYVLGLSAILFAIFYAIGIFFRKWNAKVALSLVCIESLLIIGAIISLGYFSHLDSSLTSIETGNTTDLNSMAETCDSLPNSKIGDCWMAVIKANPRVDVCSLAKQENSKHSCVFYMGILYRDTNNNCEGTDYTSSYSKKDDPVEYARLTSCWADKAKIYPGLDICSSLWTLEWNREKCTAFFKTLPQ